VHYVYSLRCKDGYYVGCTADIDDRLRRHRAGLVSSTARRLPVALEFYFAINDKNTAFKLEKYFKSGSGRAFINKRLASLSDTMIGYEAQKR
jgi:predicted GIY-YIG superfamily endonuclease